MVDEAEVDLYAVLGVSRQSKDLEIRRAYRNLITTAHPDKGGDAQRFTLIQRAYDVLGNDSKRKQYDATGRMEKTVDEEFMDSFGGGAFRDKARQQQVDRESMAEQLAVRQGKDFQSHSAGFEAWMRSRGDSVTTFTAENAAEQFGVVKSSYEAVPLPSIRAYQARVKSLGKPKESLELVCEPIPQALEWGEVLVSMRAAPLNPADLYDVQTGGPHGIEALKTPFIAGNDGVGTIVKVGPGVKNLQEGDWILPFTPHLGTWRSLAVVKEKDTLKIPVDLMPMEYAAMMRELCVAYRLLEDYGNLRPGDTVILNAANSTVGQVVIQLCHLLKLRSVAVVRDLGSMDRVAPWLKTLGANEVLADTGSLKKELEKHKYFAKPKLALDCVGGQSAARLADTLDDSAPLVIYGCMSGRAPSWPWNQWVFKQMQVNGFNLRKWMKTNKKKIPDMMEAIAKLVNADKLRVTHTEYELGTEFDEALDHAMEEGRSTKILLKVKDIGVTY
ncbi:trans-2-enoyl-CoA reductase [Chloropicon primus]|uniref:enoyl-[acyl-carrier-protein] reductase n=1 Tax=Chloropicon primus TaxID=1764295 RepID=A0A5B8MUT2_9CHLO|nr:trans-2-enoyl-CoA reductase [Chloropicon primus]UPR02373.1 trans-2-enoyl-CoA reductase [Chloropicon primus]|eukprot:QDZ23160.1 trans-2-enoyl-CoA reductase [Chloropicon primus]